MFEKWFVVFLLLGEQFLDGTEGAVYQPGAFSPLRVRRVQHRSAMYPQPEMMYIPGMTAFTAGDTFTGYLDPVPVDKPCPNCRIPEPEPEPQPQPQSEQTPDFEESTKVNKNEVLNPPEEETRASSATQIPILEESTTQKTRTRVATRPPPEEEEEDDYEDMFTGFKGRKGVPHNVFFPMMFGPGYGRSGQGGYPGVTAIANAFSSGKGGVATSHATAFGNAPPVNNKQWKRSQHNN